MHMTYDTFLGDQAPIFSLKRKKIKNLELGIEYLKYFCYILPYQKYLSMLFHIPCYLFWPYKDTHSCCSEMHTQ